MTLADENAYLAVGDPVTFEVGCLHHDEKLVAIDVYLGHLFSGQGVLDCQRMKAEHGLEGFQFALRRRRQADPGKLVLPGVEGLRQERHFLRTSAVKVKVGGYDGQWLSSGY